MDNFAFMIHPVNPKADVARKYPLLARVLPVGAIHFLSQYFPPVYISHITGIRSAATGKEIEGWFVACPMTAQRLRRVPVEVAYRKIVQTGRLAERLGARLLGLGAFTSVVGDAGITVARRLNIPVTTGISYTVAIAVEAVREAARRVGLPLNEARAAVVGATGAVGSVCARLLARDVAQIILIGRRASRLEEIRSLVEEEGEASVVVSTAIEDIGDADLIISATSAVKPIIKPHHLKAGAVVYDIAVPRDVSPEVQARQDVLVIDGGMVVVPGDVDFGFDFGFPPGMAYACMAETMILALEGRYECYTLGRDVQLERVDEIARLGKKHGFQLGGFRSFGRVVSEAQIERVREYAQAI